MLSEEKVLRIHELIIDNSLGSAYEPFIILFIKKVYLSATDHAFVQDPTSSGIKTRCPFAASNPVYHISRSVLPDDPDRAQKSVFSESGFNFYIYLPVACNRTPGARRLLHKYIIIFSSMFHIIPLAKCILILYYVFSILTSYFYFMMSLCYCQYFSIFISNHSNAAFIFLIVLMLHLYF
mgnify:CR=1 FL=1